jgi:hypothetical protein
MDSAISTALFYAWEKVVHAGSSNPGKRIITKSTIFVSGV